MRKNTKLITRTAILLALTVVFQMLGRYIPLGPNSNFIVGPLVNACLLISTAASGLWGGAVVAVISPFSALITGGAVPLPFLPFIAIGNFILVLLFYVLRRNMIGGILSGSVLKFGFLYAAITLFLKVYTVPQKVFTVLSFLFSWPQLVTALIGGLIALIVIKALGKQLDFQEV